MQTSSVRLRQTFPQARARVVRRDKFLTPLLLMLAGALLFVWLDSVRPRLWSDAGGYEAMLFHHENRFVSRHSARPDARYSK